MDEAMSFIALHVLNNLQFHLDGCNTPLAIWTKLGGLFGIVNKFIALQIQVENTSLVPYYFPSIEDFLMKFKQKRSLLQGYGKNKTDTECIYLILSKLCGNFQIFAYTFYSTKYAFGTILTMPSFEVFFDHLTREKAKLSQLDSLTSSQTHALVAHTSSGKKEKKHKSHPTKSQIDSSSHLS